MSVGPSPSPSPRALAERVTASPLLRFLALGAVVFGIVTWQGGFADDADRDADADVRSTSSTIRVTRAELLVYIQLRTRSADAVEVARAFDALDAGAREAWIDRFVREEALVREARRLGLDRDDDLIRRRLVQQMEFIAGDLAAERTPITAAEIEAAYAARAEDYREPTVVTFDHLFVRDGDGAEARARQLLGRARATPGDAESLGDRFLYHRRYVERTIDEVRSHFGGGFPETIADLTVDAARWQGPIRSAHGWHLVRLTDRVDTALPSLETLWPTLERDLIRGRHEEVMESGLDAIVGGYSVEIEGALRR